MRALGDRLRTRLLPALLTASGITLLAAGLLTYTTPVTAETIPSATPDPSSASVDPTASPLITLPPLSSAAPTVSPTADPEGHATRVRIAALDIDLPVIRGGAGYPKCNVAMYLKELRQPGQGGATYLYAHARDGMFLPLLETKESRQKGMVVEVWTSDDLRYLYEIVDVRRNQTSLDDPLAATSEELWLQTSEGPRGTVGKTQVIAMPLSVERADHKAANPKPKPVTCA